jgi:hypothetical protein
VSADVRERQRCRFRLNRVALRTRETAPGLNRHSPRCTSPRADDFPIDEDGTRPDARRPESAATNGIGDEKFAIASLKEEVGVAAREETNGRGGLW